MSDHTNTEKKDDIWKSWSHLQWFQATGMRYQTNKSAACQGFSKKKKNKKTKNLLDSAGSSPSPCLHTGIYLTSIFIQC